MRKLEELRENEKGAALTEVAVGTVLIAIIVFYAFWGDTTTHGMNSLGEVRYGCARKQYENFHPSDPISTPDCATTELGAPG